MHPGSGIATDRIETIVAVLSMGPVGPSDSLAWLGNRSAWLKAACNSEGVLLQPSTPIRTIDAKFALPPTRNSGGSGGQHDAGGGTAEEHGVPMGSEVWASSSTVVGPEINYTTHIVLALSLPKAGFTLWRNDTEPAMEAGVEYVYRVHGSMLPTVSSSVAAPSPPQQQHQCSNGSSVVGRSRHAQPQPASVAPVPAAAPPKCIVQPGRDLAGGGAAVSYPGHPQTIPNSTHDSCCAACDANPSCTAWVFGPLNGVPTCFLARDVQGTKPSNDRDFCCMSSSHSSSRRRAAAAQECVSPVPAAGVPLSTLSPGDVNCSAGPAAGKDPTQGHELVTVYPTVHGFVLLGELEKWVTLSPNRFSNLAISATSLSVDVRGGVGELVAVTVVVEGTVVVREVRIGVANVETLLVRK